MRVSCISRLRSLVLGLFVVVSVFAPVLSSSAETTVHAAAPSPHASHSRGKLDTGPLPGHFRNSRPLHAPTNVPKLAPVASKKALDPVDLKILVISADGNEADLPAIRQALDYLGEPYTVYVATQTPGGLTSNTLYSGVHGYYQGVILTTGDLGYNNNGNWQSALSTTEWQSLWTFEGTFGIRQLTWYTYPTADYGFNAPSAAFDSSSNPVSAAWTSAATPAFGYVNKANALTIQGGWTYLATPLTDGSTTTVLKVE